MRDLSRVKKDEKRYYMEYVYKKGRWKGRIRKIYGQIKICFVCNEPFFTQNSHVKNGFGRFCSHSCPVKGKNSWFYGKHQAGKLHPMYGVHRMGKSAPNWKGGIGKEPYPFDFDKELKEEIRKRDDYVCQFPKCKKKENGKAHNVHHIDYDKDNLNPMNLITLCHKCNVKANGNRDYWKEYFGNFLCSKITK